MRFTKVVLVASVTAVLGFIVVPTKQPVNHAIPASGSSQIRVADGMPLPPLPPPKGGYTALVADGMPLPPLPPPKGNYTVLVADGMPLPPLPPPRPLGVQLAKVG
jgi:hypothetical protein